MKGKIRLLLLAVSLTAFCGTMAAQEEGQAPTREQRIEVRAKRMAERIAMDDEDTKRFVEVYCQYRKELRELCEGLGPRGGQLSEKEAEEALKQRFDHRQKFLDLQRKYYDLYSDFLTQKQIKRVYELESRPAQRWGRSGRPGGHHGHYGHHGRHCW